MSSIHVTPFITKGVTYRNDFLDTGSLILANTSGANGGTFFTDGDILTVSGSSNKFVGAASNNLANGTSGTLTANNVIAGQIIVVYIGQQVNNNSVSSVTDTAGTVYSKQTTVLNFPTSTLELWTG